MSFVTILQEEVISLQVEYSGNALYIFECFMMLSEEVNVIWRRKWGVMAWIYMAIRYSTLLLAIWSSIPDLGQGCKAMQYINTILELIQMLSFALFSALRVYALQNGKLSTAMAVLLLNLVPVATNMYSGIVAIAVEDGEACASVLRISVGLNLALTLATRLSVIVGDVLVLVVTWSKSARSYQEAQKLGLRAPIATILVRDGTFYFVALLFTNVLQLVETNTPTLFTLQIAGRFMEILPSITICRFILSLRQVKAPGSSWMDGSKSGTLRFAGNMGELLRVDGDDENDEGDEDVGDDDHDEELNTRHSGTV